MTLNDQLIWIDRAIAFCAGIFTVNIILAVHAVWTYFGNRNALHQPSNEGPSRPPRGDGEAFL